MTDDVTVHVVRPKIVRRQIYWSEVVSVFLHEAHSRAPRKRSSCKSRVGRNRGNVWRRVRRHGVVSCREFDWRFAHTLTGRVISNRFPLPRYCFRPYIQLRTIRFCSFVLWPELSFRTCFKSLITKKKKLNSVI